MHTLDIALIGATGLVGHLLLAKLAQLNDVNSIIAITRKPLEKIPAKTENLVIDFENMSDHVEQMRADIFICCLGTTIKIAGSQEAFRHVDYDYVVQFAQIAEQVHAKKFQVVSSMGADAESRVFYNRTKGEMEEKIKEFRIPQIEIFRPSLILGDRKDKRGFEGLAQTWMPKMNFLLTGSWEKYRPIQATSIANAMAIASTRFEPGHRTYSSNVIQELSITR